MIEIVHANNKHLHSLCVYIRIRVFMDEQKYTLDNELEPDEDDAVFFLALVDKKPAGMVRYRILGERARIERLAVLPEYRGQGIGAQLMETVLKALSTIPGLRAIELIAQEDGIKFHEQYGFKPAAVAHMEAGHMHYLMIKTP